MKPGDVDAASWSPVGWFQSGCKVIRLGQRGAVGPPGPSGAPPSHLCSDSMVAGSERTGLQNDIHTQPGCLPGTGSTAWASCRDGEGGLQHAASSDTLRERRLCRDRPPVRVCPGDAVLCMERIRRARGEGRREEEKEGWRAEEMEKES
ncbi:hypothetical protein EYF80_015493 [Liparis tanakae]|uniref:Uncharacterized protein n=1 Tax=Liparis tanakae TaxID=230148 RepID=A0A4Z2I8P9_9TELE|nr:hypothetical protein EYF80_015493 [Liparis tanakae]